MTSDCLELGDAPGAADTHIYSLNSILTSTRKKNMSESQPHSCKQCGKSFHQRGTLEAHLLSHLEAPLSCGFCGKVYKHLNHYHNHMRIHTKEKPFSCDQCGRSFAQKINLKTHLRTHTGERPYACDKCEMKFTRKNNLRKHRCTLHACRWCDRSFSVPAQLWEHLRTHAGEKHHACDRCDKRFALKGTLTQHKRTHVKKETSVVKERIHHCDQCEKSFTEKSYLTKHKLTHVEHKPYQCDQCEKSYADRKYLVRHLVSHTKPFRCDECGKSFSLRGSLKRHQLVHAEGRQRLCGCCGKSFLRSHTCFKNRLDQRRGKLSAPAVLRKHWVKEEEEEQPCHRSSLKLAVCFTSLFSLTLPSLES